MQQKLKPIRTKITVKGARILVVEDEETVMKLFSHILEMDGYYVETAETGEQAVELIETNQYNLLIVDKNLPGISGLEVVKLARQIQPHTEVIIITGYASYQSAVSALRLGVFDYLEKPFPDINIISEKVQRALERQKLVFENRVLARHLRTAGQSIEAYEKSLSDSISDVEKVELYLQKMAERVTMEIRDENARLTGILSNTARQIYTLQSCLIELAENWKDAPPELAEAEKLIRLAWRTLGPVGDLSKSPWHPADVEPE